MNNEKKATDIKYIDIQEIKWLNLYYILIKSSLSKDIKLIY